MCDITIQCLFMACCHLFLMQENHINSISRSMSSNFIKGDLQRLFIHHFFLVYSFTCYVSLWPVGQNQTIELCHLIHGIPMGPEIWWQLSSDSVNSCSSAHLQMWGVTQIRTCGESCRPDNVLPYADHSGV